MSFVDTYLYSALTRAVAGVPHHELHQRVVALSHRYRAQRITDTTPGMSDALDALAYAVVRMPATVRALYAALTQARQHVDSPVMTHLDLGGGTGAAAWAANAVWPEARGEIIERLPAALALGKQLGTAGPSARGGQDVDAGTVGSAWRWTLADLRTWTPPGRPVDLVTIGYVLNELGSPARADLLRKATAVATTVVVVEPGTPAGHRRTLEARDFLIDQEFRIAAPCPHQGSCPVDWCHFATRLPRTELHRTLKDGSRNYEDEKFSYVVATRAPVRPAAARVLTRPVKRKGQALLDLCTATGTAERVVVPKSSPAYRPTRNTTWGDTWNGLTR